MKIIYLFLFLIFIFSTFFYIFELNLMAKDISLIKKFQKEKKSLVQENKLLKIKFVNYNSFERIFNLLSENRNFERVSEVDYLQIPETILSKR